MIQPETRYAAVGTDRVAYQVLGEGPRDLVHTIGLWSQVDVILEDPSTLRYLRRLASFSRVILFDARGSGLSDPRPADGGTVRDHWAQDLLAVLDATGSRAATIMGMTDAGLLALLFAERHADRCSGLVLFNATARPMAAPDYPIGFTDEQLQIFEDFVRNTYGTDKWSDWFCPSLVHNEQLRGWTSRWRRRQAPPKTVMANVREIAQMDVRHVLPSIRVPALVMTRRGYRMWPVAHGRYVAEHIPGARFIELPGADGLPFWETPDQILDLVEEFVTGMRHGGEPDRMLTTVLFTDIVGSTERAAKLGDAAWRALLDRHDNALREQVGLFGGKVADHSGDGSLSTFENPRRAIECALALHRALTDIGVEIRAGVHFGEVEKRADGGVSGVSVHVGARVMSLADAGEVLISGTLRQILIGSRYEFEDRGTHELKGVPDQWRIYAVSERQ